MTLELPQANHSLHPCTCTTMCTCIQAYNMPSHMMLAKPTHPSTLAISYSVQMHLSDTCWNVTQCDALHTDHHTYQAA